ncbi:MAG: YveK family protein [Mycobacterium leprae]
MNEPRETQKLANGIRRRWKLLVALTVLAGLVGFAVSVATPSVYAASTSVLIGETAGPGLDNSTVKASQSMAQTFSDLARRQPVLQGAVSDLRLDTTWQELRERVSAAVPVQNPQLVTITVRAPSREEATGTAAAIARRLVALGSNTTDDVARGFVTARLADLQKNIQAASAQLATAQKAGLLAQQASLEAQIDTWQRAYVSLLGVRATEKAVVPRVFEPAEALSKPVRPAILTTTLLAALLGLILGIVLLYALEVRYWVHQSRAQAEPAGDERLTHPRGSVPAPADGAGAQESPALEHASDRPSADLARSDLAF